MCILVGEDCTEKTRKEKISLKGNMKKEKKRTQLT